jgi:N4-gp56 family major capsid protein
MMHHTSMLSSSPAFNTQPIEPAFIAFVHPDVENDIREMQGFISTKHYAGATPMDGEIGAVEDVRYIRSTVFESYADGGGLTSTMISTTGTNADVYPVIYVAKDSYGIVPLRGMARGNRMSMNAATISVVQPKVTETDPLAQRGIASWKVWTETVILNDFGVIRAEVAATD